MPSTFLVGYHERASQLSRTVARVVLPADAGLEGYATGFLIPGNWFITNHHVLPTPEVAALAVIEFNYERDHDGFLLPVRGFKVDPAPEAYIASDYDTGDDWVAVRLRKDEAGKDAVGEFGAVPVKKGVGVAPGDTLTLFQHPAGQPKRFHTCPDAVRPSPDPARRLHYHSETAVGSSGSPVFNERWELVAIHHRSQNHRDPATARLFNHKIGTPIDLIIAALEARRVWPPAAAPTRPKPVLETGGMAPGNAWYVSRDCDQKALRALEGEAATLFIVGARHSGKSSLARRHAHMQEALGWPHVWFDAETDFNAAHHASVEKVFDRMIQRIARRFPHRLSAELEGARGTPSYLKDYLAEAFPNGSDKKLALFIDRADSFLGKPCADDLFLGLRSVNDANLHANVRLVLTYSRNMRQSTQRGSIFAAAAEVVTVEDFSREALADLHSRYAAPLLRPDELDDLHTFLGGHPLLCRQTLNALHFGRAAFTYAALKAESLAGGGIFEPHLLALLRDLENADADVREAFARLLQGRPRALTRKTFDALVALGLVTGPTLGQARVRSTLYAQWLPANL